MGLERRAAELAGALPYGEQRLLGIALALAAQPSMLLLDEPVSGMNPSETAKVMKLVETIRASGVTILLVEHDMPMVMQVSDRIVVLNYGRIIAEGSAGGHPETIPRSFARIWEKERSVLELRDVVCCYGQVTALKGISLTRRQRPACRLDRRERSRQDDDLEGDLGIVASDCRNDCIRRARHHPRLGAHDSCRSALRIARRDATCSRT